jgi:uncharacterized repeat protein (TIGR03803 family)
LQSDVWLRRRVPVGYDQQVTVLYTFTGGTDGGLPSSGLIRDGSGNLYGSAVNGGTYGQGVIFKVTPSGKQTVLHNFSGGTDGAFCLGWSD